MKTNGRFYTLFTSDIEFEIDSISEPMPVLWNNDGLFRIVPIAVVKNAFENLAMWSKSETRITSPIAAIYWDQGIPINNAAGRALVGE